MSSFDDLSKSPPSPPRSPRPQSPASQAPASPTLPQEPGTPSSILFNPASVNKNSADSDRDPEKNRQEAWDEEHHAVDHSDKENLSERLQGTHITDSSPVNDQRPGVNRFDTDTFEDYPDTAPRTPGEDLKASPYAEEHPAIIRDSSSSSLPPASGVGGSEASVAPEVGYAKYGVGSAPSVSGSTFIDPNGMGEPSPATPSSLLWPETPSGPQGPLLSAVGSEPELPSAQPASPLHTLGATAETGPDTEHDSDHKTVDHAAQKDEQKQEEKESHKVGIVEKIKDALSGHKDDGKNEHHHEK